MAELGRCQSSHVLNVATPLLGVEGATRRRAVFLDRDGVINEDLGYVSRIGDFRLLDSVVESLQALQENGFALVVITNQSGIGRGFYTEADYEALTSAYMERLSAAGVILTAVLHCPHQPADNCHCRKPRPGMLVEAARCWNLDLHSSYLVGDKQSDIDAGMTAGLRACVRVLDHGAAQSTCAYSLREAVGVIQRLDGSAVTLNELPLAPIGTP